MTITILISFFKIFENNFNYYSTISDFYSRFYPNDFFLNLLYLIWTNFWYIPLLYFLLVIFYKNQITIYPRSTFLILTNIVIAIFIFYYQNYNINQFSINLFGENFNLLLTNSINKFHPIIFYISTLGIFITTTSNIHRDITFFNTFNLINVKYYSMRSLSLIIFTLFLGSWWALQEGSWGGWWNWDPSEVFGLFFMIIYIYINHLTFNQKNFIYINHLNFIHFCTLVVIYFFIQLNFELISHNFNIKQTNFLNSLYTLAYLSLFFLIKIIYELVRYYKLSCRVNFFFKYFIKIHLWNFLFYIYITLVLFSSFNILINDFFWKTIKIHFFNTIGISYIFTTTTFLILIILLWNPTPIFISFWTISTFFNQNIFLLTVSIRRNLLNKLHILILIIFFTTLPELTQQINIWVSHYSNSTFTNYSTINDLSSSKISLNNFFIENIFYILDNNIFIEAVWNVICGGTSNEIHSISHSLSHSGLVHKIYSGFNLYIYFISVVDLSISATFILFFSIYQTYIYTFKKHFIIIS